MIRFIVIIILIAIVGIVYILLEHNKRLELESLKRILNIHTITDVDVWIEKYKKEIEETIKDDSTHLQSWMDKIESLNRKIDQLNKIKQKLNN